jgi:hypothetical protein
MTSKEKMLATRAERARRLQHRLATEAQDMVRIAREANALPDPRSGQFERTSRPVSLMSTSFARVKSEELDTE